MIDSARAFYLSSCELYVLIQSYHIAEITIFKELLEQNPSQEEIGLAVTSLIRRRFLEDGGDERFRMSDELRSIMDALKQAEWTAKLSGQLMSIPQQIIYGYKDMVVSLQMDEMRAGYVRIAQMSLEDLTAQIMEYDFLPQENMDYEDDCEDFSEEEYHPEDFPGLEYGEEEQMDTEEILLRIEISGREENGQNRRLMVYRLPLRDVILLTGRETFRVRPYGRDNLIDGIMELSHDFS